MYYSDSHAHLSSEELLPQIDHIMMRAKNASVTKIINICTDAQTLKDGLLLETRFPEIKNAGAITPHDVDKLGELEFPLFAEAAKSRQLVAVGETGLDYHYLHSDRDMQIKFLVRYLHLAQECALPIIFHCREAFSDLFSIADNEYGRNLPAILHCFTGTVAEAEEVLQRGWFLSLSGIVTFKKSELLRRVAQMVPLSQLLIETDAPYLAPQRKRGQQNEPAFLPEIAECIANVKNISIEKVVDATYANCCRVFAM